MNVETKMCLKTIMIIFKFKLFFGVFIFIGTVKVSINGTTDGTKSSKKSQNNHSNHTTTNNNNNHFTKDNKHPTTSLMKMVKQNNKDVTESGKSNNTTSKATLPKETPGNNSTSTTTAEAANKMLAKLNETGSDDNFAKLEKEKDKLAASLANLKLLDISQQKPPSNPVPPIHFNNTIMADTEDTQVVTHDFSPIKNMEDRAKTVATVFKQNGSVILAADGSSKHLFIPNYHDALKFNNNSNDKDNNKDQVQLLNNETLSSATNLANATSAASSTVDLQNSTMVKNMSVDAKNSTTDLQQHQQHNESAVKNSTTTDENHHEGQDKLMTYINGMSKLSADIKNDTTTTTTANTTADMDRYSDDYEVSNHLDTAEADPVVATTTTKTHPKDEDPLVATNFNSDQNKNKTTSSLATNSTATESESKGSPLKNSREILNSTLTKNTTTTDNTATATLSKQEDSKQKNATVLVEGSSSTSKKHEDAELEEQNRMEDEKSKNSKINDTISNKSNNNNLKEDEEEEEEVRQIKMSSNNNSDNNNNNKNPGMTTTTNKTVETEDELRQGTADHQQQTVGYEKPTLSNITNSQNSQSLTNQGNMTNTMTAPGEINTTTNQLDGEGQSSANNNLKNLTHHHHHHHHQHQEAGSNQTTNSEQFGKVDNTDSSISNRTLNGKKETNEKKTESPSRPSSNDEQPYEGSPKETTFQMQNTTYKVFDSNPSPETSSVISQPSSLAAATTVKNRPDVSKVEKASYDKALGIDSKVMTSTNKQQNSDNMTKKLPKKTPTKVEQQSYRPPALRHIGGDGGGHQQTKRKLLMNVTLAEAMEKMNPSTPTEQVCIHSIDPFKT